MHSTIEEMFGKKDLSSFCSTAFKLVILIPLELGALLKGDCTLEQIQFICVKGKAKLDEYLVVF